MIDKQHIETALQAVKDPEIPYISVLELGIIRSFDIENETSVNIIMTPTFTGCPAIDYMKTEIAQSVAAVDGVENVQIEVSFKEAWNSNMISEVGRQKIADFGIAPPKQHCGQVDLADVKNVDCPNCGSKNTSMNSMFGPTLCRSIHACFDCKETFEAFKPL